MINSINYTYEEALNQSFIRLKHFSKGVYLEMFKASKKLRGIVIFGVNKYTETHTGNRKVSC